jgi:hypothetical protein
MCGELAASFAGDVVEVGLTVAGLQTRRWAIVAIDSSCWR